MSPQPCQAALTGQGPQHPSRGLEGCHLGGWEWQARKDCGTVKSYGRGWELETSGKIMKCPYDLIPMWLHLSFFSRLVAFLTVYLGWFRSSRWCRYIHWHIIPYHMVHQIIWVPLNSHTITFVIGVSFVDVSGNQSIGIVTPTGLSSGSQKSWIAWQTATLPWGAPLKMRRSGSWPSHRKRIGTI